VARKTLTEEQVVAAIRHVGWGDLLPKTPDILPDLFGGHVVKAVPREHQLPGQFSVVLAGSQVRVDWQVWKSPVHHFGVPRWYTEDVRFAQKPS
jgi:hypothetical protein